LKYSAKNFIGGNIIDRRLVGSIRCFMCSPISQDQQHPTQRSEGIVAERHASVLLADTPDELEQAYDEWAVNYTEDLGTISGLGADGWGKSAMKVMIDKVELAPQTHPIFLDFACGPGMAGPLFQELGWGSVRGSVLHGNDLSQGMLDVAKSQGAYSKLIKSTFGDSKAESNFYNAIHCSGLFAPGQAPPTVFDEFIKLLKVGGLVVFTVRTSYYDGDEGAAHKAYLEDLCHQGRWELISQTEEEYLPKEDLYCYVFVMKKL
jgi:SAM-dependent methyltransferase